MSPIGLLSTTLFRPGSNGATLRLRLAGETGSDYFVQLDILEPTGEWQILRRFSGLADREAADAVYRRVLTAKLADGYLSDRQPVPAVEGPQRTAPEGLVQGLLRGLSADDWRLLTPAKRGRLVWRVGELRLARAVPRLVELLESGEPMLDYCLAWSIGRCRDRGASGAMEQLMRVGRNDMVRRVAAWAAMELAEPAARAQWAARLVADWPVALRDAWAEGCADGVCKAVDDLVTWQRFRVADWIESLDLVAQGNALGREVLLRLLPNLAPQAGNFRALRHIYKAAEFRGDGEIWSLLQRRFERSPASFSRSTSDQQLYLDGKWVSVKDELERNDSRLAYSQRTRNYLLRRGWRSLRRLASAASPEFAPLAWAALNGFDDAASPPVEVERWVRKNDQWQRQTQYRHAHASSPLFNRLLFRAGGPVRFHSITRPCDSERLLPAERQERLEPFAALWNERPDLALRLALGSRAEWIHGFAVRVLADCGAYCARLDDNLWSSLLNSPFAVTAEFAHSTIGARIRAENDPAKREEWLVLLLGSRHQNIVHAGLALIEDDPAAHAASPALVAGVLTARSAEVRRHARLLCQVAATHAGTGEQIISRLLDWLALADRTTEALDSIVENLAWVIAHPLREQAAQADYDDLLALARQSTTVVRCLAVDWLIAHNRPLQHFPADLFRQLLDSEEPRLTAAGLRVLRAMPLPILSQQSALLGLFCVSPHAQIRAEAFQAVQRLLAHDPGAGAALMPDILSALYRSETGEDQHADLYRLLTGVLADASRALPQATVISLLRARSKAAQTFGAWLLDARPDETFSDSDWIALATCDTQAVRQRALAFIDRRFSTLPFPALLPILDSRWEDSRAQVLEWLHSRMDDARWQSHELLALADHAAPAVRTLGCTLLAQRLASGRDTECLLALAQHPSQRVQHFVADWLEKALGEDAEKLRQFMTYFRTVLSLVNKGRPIKRAVHALLRERALRSEALAREIAGLFEWLAVTVAIGDKAQYIAGLHEIRRAFPDIASGLTVVIPETRAASQPGLPG